ncbi:hypothetical protein TSTA_043220 [Talaromyces stipitatus ATCC 10500]|uniref:Uncharacterized protein n=1 Tax=Talaromyces stipitatus (strain ATCC 10500 / CBS 375.48 / QM 6759 / NRRL 1006) TaxID=441959 RepID=B8MK30_TALSN|nr:uncharacterized protein TSTA_043220 [Talaromyces stipitatus ATCC 10500]EED14847.1 hypothetical protein TSTA_043220 [Talaromyces stipitatus ATCC 10500]
MKSKAKWPVVVLEVGISETTEKLYDDVEQWLKGSSGQTKSVILVDVQKKGRQDTSTDKWELSKVDFLKSSHDSLSNHTFQWYRSRKIRDEDKQCILNEVAFLPGKLIDLTNIQDAPLRLDYLMPDGSDFDTIVSLKSSGAHATRWP